MTNKLTYALSLVLLSSIANADTTDQRWMNKIELGKQGMQPFRPGFQIDEATGT